MGTSKSWIESTLRIRPLFGWSARWPLTRKREPSRMRMAGGGEPVNDADRRGEHDPRVAIEAGIGGEQQGPGRVVALGQVGEEGVAVARGIGEERAWHAELQGVVLGNRAGLEVVAEGVEGGEIDRVFGIVEGMIADPVELAGELVEAVAAVDARDAAADVGEQRGPVEAGVGVGGERQVAEPCFIKGVAAERDVAARGSEGESG
jgi:hypothetical protein